MTIANAIKEGLTGATTLNLLEEALHKIDPKAPRSSLSKGGIIKKLKKNSGKKGVKASKLYVTLATELLTNASYFGLTGLGKKKNALLRGGLLGAAAGLGAAFLSKSNAEDDFDPENNSVFTNGSDAQKKALTVALYTAGGLLAGFAFKKMTKKGSKKNKRKKNKK